MNLIFNFETGDTHGNWVMSLAMSLDKPVLVKTRYQLHLGTHQAALSVAMADQLAVERLGYYICGYFRQDAVAVLDKDSGDGWFVGPLRHQYGPFCIKRFWYPESWRS